MEGGGLVLALGWGFSSRCQSVLGGWGVGWLVGGFVVGVGSECGLIVGVVYCKVGWLKWVLGDGCIGSRLGVGWVVAGGELGVRWV